jgi:hypothetical protein
MTPRGLGGMCQDPFGLTRAVRRVSPGAGGSAPGCTPITPAPVKLPGTCTSLKERAGVKRCRPWVLVALRCLQGVVS